jgi:hypothetical protein
LTSGWRKGDLKVRKIYNMKKTISVRQFIAELGEGFTNKMKQRLLELGSRCILTRKEDNYRLDLKHIEHTQFEVACTSDKDNSTCKREYLYGQFVVVEGLLYFSEKCNETAEAIQQPVVSTIYDNLSSEGIISDKDVNAKKIDDSNIDYVIDTILGVCPPVSAAHLAIVKGMTSRSER